jgi:multidrug transporter EmrE-like cation transporter
MMHDTRSRWWHGKRGEWYVAAQLVLIGHVSLRLPANALRIVSVTLIILGIIGLKLSHT